MTKIISQSHCGKLQELCKKGKHKLRENEFGVVWCVHCGLLSNSVGGVQKIKEDDKIIVQMDK